MSITVFITIWLVSFLFNILACKYNKWLYEDLASPSVKKKGSEKSEDQAICWYVFLSMMPGVQFIYNIIGVVYIVGTFLKKK